VWAACCSDQCTSLCQLRWPGCRLYHVCSCALLWHDKSTWRNSSSCHPQQPTSSCHMSGYGGVQELCCLGLVWYLRMVFRWGCTEMAPTKYSELVLLL
jgi:hypothetical protein